MPDENDILYTNYSLDFLGFFKRLFEKIFGGMMHTDGFMHFLHSLWEVWSIIAFILSALFIYGIIYSYLRLAQLSEIEAKKLQEEEQAWKQRYEQAATENRRWYEAKQHIESDNPNDWKQAIIEADVILGDLLDEAGYAGNSIGEKLKSASSSGFSTIQDAWDAHLIRNKIAHREADFVLTHAKAKEAMIKYERVFKEFGLI